MSTLTASRATTDETTTTRTAIVAAGLIGALACAAYVSSVIFLPDVGARTAGTHPLVLTANLITALAFGGLAFALPRLAGLTRLPQWTLYTSAAACAFIAAPALTFATYGNHVKAVLTDAQAEQLTNNGSVYLDLLSYPKILLAVVGFVALAVIGWRRRTFSRGASVLLALAAIVSLLPPPWPGGVLAGLALAWVARTARITEA